MILAGSLVVALGLTGYVLYSRTKTTSQNQPVDQQSAKLEKQASTDDATSIEKDLKDTDLDNIDKESVSIQTEINSTN